MFYRPLQNTCNATTQSKANALQGLTTNIFNEKDSFLM